MDTSKKIIRGIVNSRGFTTTSAITQWDYGWQFIPEIDDLPPTYRLDFSNEEKHGTALPVYCGSEGAEVPTELIDTGKDIWVWFVRIGDGYGITEYKWRIPNKCKPKTEQDEPTPSQQSSIDQLITRSNEAVESAEQSAEDASASAQNASADAERAEEARTDAQNYATQAEQSATDAHESASQASASASASAQSASQSAQIKVDVEDLADDAQEYAQSAEQSAQNAHTYALSANAASGTAENFADVASGYASQAQSSAQTASAKAQDASTSAQTASQKATESAQSASQALTYNTDAESAKTASQTAQGLAESARDDAISAKNDAESARDDAESARDEAVQAVASISGALDDKADVITDTASGAVASFTDGADGLPLKSLVVSIEPKQDGTGDPSPDNVRPISGWTGANIYDDPIYGGEIDFNQMASLDADDWGYAYRMKMESSGRIMTFTLTSSQSIKNINLPLVSGHRYLFDAYINNTMSNSVFYGIWKQVTENNYVTRTTTATGVSERKQLIWYANTYTPFFRFQAPTSPDYGEYFTVENMQLFDLTLMFGEGNEPATVEEFYELFTDEYHEYNTGEKTCVSAVNNEPYRFIPISWQTEAGTVYGGKLDVLTGKLTIEMADVDLGTLTWTYQESYHSFNSSGIASRVKIPSSSNVNIGGLCSAYVVRSVSQVILNDNGLGVSTSGTIGIIDTRFTDPTEFKTAVDGVHYVYPLATPIEIQLTPTEVSSLLGQNNIFADTGDSEVEYRADTKLYIERLTAPDSSDMIADSNIVSGQYFMVGNTLYKATANIANGGQIIVGTNCTRVSLAQALNEINA